MVLRRLLPSSVSLGVLLSPLLFAHRFVIILLFSVVVFFTFVHEIPPSLPYAGDLRKIPLTSYQIFFSYDLIKMVSLPSLGAGDLVSGEFLFVLGASNGSSSF